jgi:hypothetical protein
MVGKQDDVSHVIQRAEGGFKVTVVRHVFVRHNGPDVGGPSCVVLVGWQEDQKETSME